MPELPEQDVENRTEERSSAWFLEDAERRLFAALPSRPSADVAEQPASSSSLPWMKFGRFGIAAGLLIAILALGYEIGHRSAPTLPLQAGVISPTPGPPGNISKTATRELSESPKVEPIEREIASLRGQIHSLNSDISKLHDQRSLLEERLVAQSRALESSIHSQDELRAQLSKSDSDKRSVETQLASAEAERSRESADASQLRAQLKELNETLQSRESDIAQNQELLKHDRDIRNLITARDLYIAEIYDVAKTGHTEKPFGRIFYTKGRSLIFYGYDLDQRPGLRNAATFQAWGRRGADDQHDVSLGILYKDDASQKRWVLKFNDSATLAQIDAVFVTVEPRGGSKKPSGKPLLFASLHIDPNHP